MPRGVNDFEINGAWDTPNPPASCQLTFEVRQWGNGFRARLHFSDGFVFVGWGRDPLSAMQDAYRSLLQLHAHRVANRIIERAAG